MKRCKHISCYTDYPIEELGDPADKVSKMRHLTALSYDGNGRAWVIVRGYGVELSIKIDRLYSSPTKTEYKNKTWHCKPVNPRKFERMVNIVSDDYYRGVNTLAITYKEKMKATNYGHQ